jgi:hypothetical protein
MSATNTALTIEERLAVEDVVTAFFHCLDSHRFQDIAALFDPAGAVQMGDRVVAQGPQAAADMFAARLGETTTRHCWSGLRTRRLEAGGLEANYVFVTHLRPKADPAAAMKYVCGDGAVQLRRGEDATWRILLMHRIPIFES